VGSHADEVGATVSKRTSLSKRTRFEVFKRDGFKCMYCGAHPPGVLLHVDHIRPVAGGGGNDMDNLVTACEACNQGKSDVSLSVVPQSLAEKAEAVREREEQLRGYHDVIEAKRQRLEDQTWEVMNTLYPSEDKVSRDEFQGTKRFIEKLGFHEVLEAAEIALAAPGVYGRRTFRYFAGICWNKIRKAEGRGD
jgi:hypothetical protein